MWSKAPFFCISFSMAATPRSLILQHKHPFASSRNSSDPSAVGSSGEDMFIAFAASQPGLQQSSKMTMRSSQTFDILELGEYVACRAVESRTAVSPNSFIMTAIRYPCFSVRIRLSNVDFPAPRKPQMIVKGTRLASSTSVCSMRSL
jgi:hypothetical protein